MEKFQLDKQTIPVYNPRSTRKAHTKVWFYANECKYEVIFDNVRKLEWKLVQDDGQTSESRANVFWIDVSTIHDRLRTIAAWQVINHFPGMPNIARKNRMGQNLNKMLKIFPKEYSFYPRTWVLPGELSDFRQQFDNAGNSLGNRIFIIKPDTGCQGRGIFLTKSFDNVPQQENVVAQLYIKKPLLIDGFKFDLRMYCLVASVKPLRMYLFKDGLVRLCTEGYTKPTKQNMSNFCMHLTNYAVNKHNSNFQQPTEKVEEGGQEEGSKRSLHWFMNTIKEERGEARAESLWRRMGTLCVRTVLSILPTLTREYDQHFRSFTNIPVNADSITNNEKKGGGDSSSDEESDDEDDAKTDTENTEKDDSPPGQKVSKEFSMEGDGRVGKQRSASEDSKPPSSPRRSDAGEKNQRSRSRSKTRLEGGSGSNGKRSVSTSGDGKSSEDAGGEETPRRKKKEPMRGSRCFEILGVDIMLDSNLKPWLIEVNHLPSFGTDSPLDLDIKDRLMAQVLKTLSVMPDDEQAYAAYHKAEAMRRLNAKKERFDKEKEEEDRIKAEKERKRKALWRMRAQQSAQNATQQAAAAAAAASAAASPGGLNQGAMSGQRGSVDKGCFQRSNSTAVSPERGGGTSGGPGDPPKSDVFHIQSNANIYRADSIAEEGGEMTPERLAEIKRLLVEIYEVHSRDKIAKIDKLLNKYDGREEEFLRFVRLKYGVAPPEPVEPLEEEQRESEDSAGARVTPREGEGSAEAPTSRLYSHHEDQGDQAPARDYSEERSSNADTNMSSNGDSGTTRSSGVASFDSRQTSATQNNQRGEGRKASTASSTRNSRSMSPSSSSGAGGGRRPVWKSDPAEDLQYRQEILSMIVPEEDDHWLQREMKYLPEFFRIFPAMPKSTSEQKLENDDEAAEEEGVEEERDDDPVSVGNTGKQDNKWSKQVKADHDDEADGRERKDSGSKEVGKVSKESSFKATYKPASFEEILFHVFVQDKRQMMRLHCPLPSRRKANSADDSSSQSVPPPDSRSGSSSATNAKSAGGGWRAPPPKTESKSSVKELTQAQSDAAKRLSQGLSVSEMAHQSVRKQYTGSVPSVVIMDEYGETGQVDESQMVAEHLWLNSRMQRAGGGRDNSAVIARMSQRDLYNGHGGRPTAAAVLRQQVFQFNSNSPRGSINTISTFMDPGPDARASQVVSGMKQAGVSGNTVGITTGGFTNQQVALRNGYSQGGVTMGRVGSLPSNSVTAGSVVQQAQAGSAANSSVNAAQPRRSNSGGAQMAVSMSRSQYSNPRSSAHQQLQAGQAFGAGYDAMGTTGASQAAATAALNGTGDVMQGSSKIINAGYAVASAGPTSQRSQGHVGNLSVKRQGSQLVASAPGHHDQRRSQSGEHQQEQMLRQLFPGWF
jgi:tubulin polyglutamylase TTLL6/13